MTPFKLQIVTPDRLFFEGEVESVIVRTIEGDIAILKDHINYVGILDIGNARIKVDGKQKIAVIAGGFVQVDEEKTTILTEAAEWPEEIDLDRAQKAKEKAQSAMNGKGGEMDMVSAEAKLKRAITRINSVEKYL